MLFESKSIGVHGTEIVLMIKYHVSYLKIMYYLN